MSEGTNSFIISGKEEELAMVRRGAALLVMLVIAALAANSVAVAQPSTTGIVLNASVRLDAKVALTWTKPPGDSAKYYLLYRTSLMSMTARATVIDSTTGNDYIDAPPSNVIPPAYSYYVEAKMKGGATLRSNFVTVYLSVPRTDVVRIVSQPVKTGRIGVPYSYQVQAVSSDTTAKLHYELLVRQTGMTIDSTGLIAWTPNQRGIFSVQVGAFSSSGGRASQYYFITVTGPTGTIAGTVTDTSDKPISRVTVRLFDRNRDDHFEYDAQTDSLGKYSIPHIGFGTYIAHAEPMKGGYLAQWYDGASSDDNATPISVTDTTIVQVNFKLKSKAVIPVFTVSGTVLDTLQKPVKDASVSFTVSSFGFNSAKPDSDDWSRDDDSRDLFDQGQARSFAIGMSGMMTGPGVSVSATADLSSMMDFRLDGNSVFVFKAKVDSLGHYSLKVPQGSYVAGASARGYYRVFYNNRSDFLSADIIKIQADVSDINFTLRPIPPIAYGSISGSVVDSSSSGGVVSRVIAYRLRVVGDDTLRVPKAYMTDTDSLGAYSIANLPPGTYVVLAIPLGHYVPSFYGVLGATRRWQDATRISVNGNAVSGIKIFVVPMLRSASGYSAVRGSVMSSTGTGGSLGKLSEQVGIEGSLIYATDNSTGSVAGYGVTNTDGSFTVAELAPGSYTVTVDKVDYSSTSSATASPTYDPTTGAAVTSTVSLSVDAVVTDVSPAQSAVPTNYVLAQNYPNPFNPTTQILFAIPQNERVTLSIYNVLGQRIATLVDGMLVQGTHVVTWNGRDGRGMQLPSGVYFYTLNASGFAASKKMLMLK